MSGRSYHRNGTYRRGQKPRLWGSLTEQQKRQYIQVLCGSANKAKEAPKREKGE